MANKKVPKHDFAPPWLKIPDQENVKPGGRSSDSDGNRHSWREDYYYGRYPPPPEYPFHPLQRQRSFDYYEDRRYAAHKMRHHSVDDDYYNSSYGYYNHGYDKYGAHYRSQPLYRDSKYQHPNAGRYQQVPPGMYPPYYDPFFEYYHGEPYYNPSRGSGGAGGGGKRQFSDTRNSSGIKAEKSSRDSKGQPHGSSTNKVNGVNESSESGGESTESMTERNTKDVNCNGNIEFSGKMFAHEDRVKSGTIGDEEKNIVNGMSQLSVSPNDSLLSSSLEAEQRLLREMGWNEADEDEYEITEDDMKEFQNLTKQMKDKQNGMMHTLPKAWSPHQCTKYKPAVQDLTDTMSSTSDDSDSDVN